MKKKTDLLFKKGGKVFLGFVIKKGVDAHGEAVRINNWYREYLEFVGDFRIKEKYATGCAQVGKSFAFYLLACVINTEFGLNMIWAYDQERTKNKHVKSHFKPLRNRWLESIGKQPLKEDSNDTVLVQFHQRSQIEFSYVSTSKDDGSGLAGTGAPLTGTTHDFAIMDERSQAPLSCWEPVANRLEQSRIPTRPTASIGTPGSGAGIEAEVEDCDYNFVPYCKCPSCDEAASLKPQDSLFRKEFDLDGKPTFLTKTGRPMAWHYSDESNPVGSAHFACSHCGAILSSEVREGAYFVCDLTGITLREFLNQLPEGKPTKPIRAAINLYCSLLRGDDKASEIIDAGLTTPFPANWIQQNVGMPATFSSSGITLEMIRSSYDRSLDSEGKDSIVVAGADQGTSDLWLWIARVYMPKGWEHLPIEQIIEKADRQLLFAEGVPIDQLNHLLSHFGVHYGFIDNEPDREAVAARCKSNCLEIADQRGQNQKPKQIITTEKVMANGLPIPCFKINSRIFCNHTYNAFALGRYSVPNWSHIPQKSERSPVRHLMAPRIDPETGWWSRPRDHIDDLFFAAMFFEAAFYRWVGSRIREDPSPSGRLSW